MKVMTKIMIVIWKWDCFTNSDANPDQAYQFVDVQKENKSTEEVAILIQIQEDKIDDDVIKALCSELKAKINIESADIFWFVHRSAQAERIIKYIIDPQVMDLSCNDSKYFLFSGGNDQIYFKTNRFGLLTASGGVHYFFKGYVKNPNLGKELSKKRYVNVLIKDENSGKELVSNYFFHKTWDYYEIEIEKKSYALMIDLLSHFMSDNAAIENNSSYSNSHWQDELATDEQLKLRVENFIQMYKVRVSNTIGMSEENHELLHDYEKKEETSYDFDDVYFNSQKEAYKELALSLENIFLKNGSSEKHEITLMNMKELFLKMINTFS